MEGAQGPRRFLDYKTYLMCKFTVRRTAEDDGFQDLVPDSPELQALFRAFRPDESGFRPLTVVLHGEPGTGRSKLASRLLLGWVQGEVLQDLFSYVFLLKARDLQGLSDRSFLDLLSQAWPDAPEAAQDIRNQPDRLLFMLDSFDELDWTIGDEDGAVCADWVEEQPVKVLLRSLLRKVLLPEASLLIMASDADLEMLRVMLVSPCYLWFGGLSLEQRLELLLDQDFSEAQQRQALHWATHCQPLLQCCQVPAVNHLLQEALNLQPATHNCTLTTLYASWVFHRLSPPRVTAEMGPCLNPIWRRMLQALCQLALVGLRFRKKAFSQDDLYRVGLWSPHIGTLARERLLLPHLHWVNHFGFLHPSLQDFFAALSHMLPEGQAWPLFRELPSLFLSVPRDAHLLSVNRFLCGLLNPELVEVLQGLLGCAVNPETRQTLLHRVASLGAAPVTHNLLSTFYCLFETQDQELVRAACAGLREVRVRLSRPMDLLVCAFCLPSCGHLQTLQMFVQGIFQNEPRLEAGPTLPPSLQTQSLVREGWQQLCGVLATHFSLRQLDLMGSVLSQWAMKVLCQQLQLVCRIQRLNLTDVQVTRGLEHLWRVLITNSRLQSLGLDCMSLQHEDVTMACAALQHPTCRLLSLRLDGCGLEDSDFLVISQVLAGATCLQSLSLSRNRMSEAALKALCQGLLAPTCTLRRLMLRSCGLTAGACQDLAKGLISSPSVTHLDLSDNHLSMQGMRLLYPALSRSAHGRGLQRLLLNWCNLDMTACSFLALALMRFTSLTHLSLSSNPLGDSSVHLLCQALQNPTCHLQELELVQCQLTAACCSSLSSVIAESGYLSSLDLSHNALGNEGLAVLCEGLGQRTSSLRRLRLEVCGLTSEGCKMLSTALSHNRSLLSLSLVGNNFDLAAMMTLCRGIAHPSCALRTIELKLEQFPASVRQTVAELQQMKPSVAVDSDWDEESKEDRFWWQQ